MNSVKLLSFVNHVAAPQDIDDAIDRAFQWGVDAVVAQGTGTDWGAHYLGSGTQHDTANFKANVLPYVRAALSHGVPFIFSVGIGGANVHLAECLDRLDELCREEDWQLNLGVIETEIDPSFLRSILREGRVVRAAYDVSELRAELAEQDVDDAVCTVGLVGPEPIAELLADGCDGVVTGRALDVALHMALPLLRGLPKAVAAHAAKVLECGGLALEPGDPGQAIWADVREDGFEVRSPAPALRATPRGLASHSFYERSNPWKESNPGGYLDLSGCAYEARGDGAVWCSGARWVDEPYTVLIEGAKSLGYRSLTVLGVRERGLLDQLPQWIEKMRRDVATSALGSSLKEGIDYEITARIYGLNGVLGDREPQTRVTGHEAGVVLDVVARTQELANQVLYAAYVRLFIGPYEGRKTTAGNTAIPFMPIATPVGEVYAFNIYHICPLTDPWEPFTRRHVKLPKAIAKAAA